MGATDKPEYRTRPCPHCGTRPDETADPLETLVACLINAVDSAVRAHASTIGRFTPGRVFWYETMHAWARITVTSGDTSRGLIPIEYPDENPEFGLVQTLADPDELLDWDPDDPRLPEGERVRARRSVEMFARHLQDERLAEVAETPDLLGRLAASLIPPTDPPSRGDR